MVDNDLTPIRGIENAAKIDHMTAGRVRRVFDLDWLQITGENRINIETAPGTNTATLDRFMELNGYSLWAEYRDTDRTYVKE
jgi:hypothetical protein